MLSRVVLSHVFVPAPIDHAWAILSDFGGWSAWNPFVARVTGASAPVVGGEVALEIAWPDGSGERTCEEIVEVVAEGERRVLRWRFVHPLIRRSLLDANRVMVLEALSETTCRFVSEERFRGPLAPAVPLGKLRESTDRMSAAFAAECARSAPPLTPSAQAHDDDAEAGDASCPHVASARAACPKNAPPLRATQPPPMVSGAKPLVGHIGEFRGAHLDLFKRGLREHGEVFAVALGPWRCAVVAGAEANARFYKRTDHELHTQKVYGYLRAMFGKVGLTQSPEGYAAESHILRAPFKAPVMRANLRLIDEEVCAFVEGLGEAGEFDLIPAFQTLLQQISARVLMGDDFQRRMDDAFWALYNDLAAGLDQSLPPWLPIPRFIRRDRAKAKLHAKLSALIAERRALPPDARPDDILQTLTDAQLADGTTLPPARVIDHVLALVFAGFETTTGHAAWGLIHLLQHTRTHHALRAQVRDLLRGVERIDRATLTALKPVRNALQETERLMPVADRHVRSAEEDIEIGGYLIPKGWIVMSAVALTHRLPELWSQPDVYAPERFERGEGGKMALVGFGGGKHRCTGVSLAYMELTILLARLLERLDLELIAPQQPEIADTLGVLLPEPTRIRYRRRADTVA